MEWSYPLQFLVWQANTVLHANFICHGAILAENGNALDLDAVLDDAGGVASNGSWCALNTGPGTNLAGPTNDGVQNTCIVLDLRVFENDGLFDTRTSSNDDTRANRDVGSDLGSWVDLGGGVNVDWRQNVCGGGRELLRSRLECLQEVQGVGWDGRTSGLDLAPKVLGLKDEELPAVGNVGQYILLQANDSILLVIVVVFVLVEGRFEVLGGGVRQQPWALGPSLDGAANGGEDALGREEVDSAVDEVGDVRLGLLDVVKHALGV